MPGFSRDKVNSGLMYIIPVLTVIIFADHATEKIETGAYISINGTINFSIFVAYIDVFEDAISRSYNAAHIFVNIVAVYLALGQ